MKSNYIVVCLLFVLTSNALSQSIFDKMSNKMCRCLEKKKVTTKKEFTFCMEEVMFDNMAELRKAYFVETSDEIDFEDFANKIVGRLTRDCDYFVRLMEKDDYNKSNMLRNDSLMTIEKGKNLTCLDVQLGDYYYIENASEPTDTTFVSFTNSTYLERMKGGKYYSRLDLEWLTDCRMEITFVESNDPFKSSRSKVGDSYVYEVVSISEKSMLIEIKLDKERFFRIEYFKVK